MQMKSRMDDVSKRASRKARGALQGHKRYRQSNPNSPESRKKPRSEKCSDASLPGTRAYSKNCSIVSNHVTDREPNGCNSADAAEQQMKPHIDSRLSIAPGVAMNASRQSSYTGNRQLNGENNIMGNTGALDFANRTIDGLPMYFANDDYSTVQDTGTVAIPKSFLNETARESAMYTHIQHPTAQNSATATNTPNAYFTNTQCSSTKAAVTALRGSSFMSHTMDGSFIHTDDYPRASNAVVAMRGSSFINNTMDGSFLYPTSDQYPTAENGTMRGLESWRPA